MRISCTQPNLQKGLSIVSRAITTRGSLAILANVFMATEKGRLKLITTDLEIAISTYIGAKVDEDGSITVPAKLLTEFVSANTDPTIELKTQEHTLQAKSSRFEANIKGLAPEEFPLVPEVKKEKKFSLPALQFKDAIQKVVFAAANDETRPVLTGVLVTVESDTLTLAATDSYRLAEKKVNLPKKSESLITAIVPARTIAEVARIIDETIDMIEVVVGENQIQFSIGATQLVSRLIEGKFPDYQQIIPQKTVTKAHLNTLELSNSIKMASFFAKDVANNIKVKTNNSDNLEVIAVSPQIGDNHSKVKAKIEGESLEVAFNAKFLNDGLQVMATQEVLIELSGPLSPGVIKPAFSKTDSKNHYLYIVMPLKLEE